MAAAAADISVLKWHAITEGPKWLAAPCTYTQLPGAPRAHVKIVAGDRLLSTEGGYGRTISPSTVTVTLCAGGLVDVTFTGKLVFNATTGSFCRQLVHTKRETSSIATKHQEAFTVALVEHLTYLRDLCMLRNPRMTLEGMQAALKG